MALPRKPKKPSPQGHGGGQNERSAPPSSQPRRPQRPSSANARPSRSRRPQPVENPYDTEEDRDVFTSNSSSSDGYYYDDNDTDDGYENDYDDVGFEDTEEAPKKATKRPARPNREEVRTGESNARRRPRRAPEPAPSHDDEYDDYEEDNSNYFDSYDSNDSEEDDVFAVDYDGLDEEEAEEMDRRRAAQDFYDVDQEEVKVAAKSKRRKAAEKKNKNRGFFNSKDKKRKKDKKGADVYVNEKTGKLEPYAKRKIKVSEFDDRKNRQKKATYIQFTVLTLGILLVGAGLKNAILPPETLSEEEVQSISLETVGTTNFPEERARVVAENFIQTYLAVGNRDISSDALSYFYTGVVDGDFEYAKVESPKGESMSVNGTFNQKVVIKPASYEFVSISDNSGYFTVGALVKPDVTLDVPEGEEKPSLDGADAKWVFFTVNVYYDEEKDMLYVTKDSPTLIPDMEVGASGESPEMGTIGNGVEVEDSVKAEIEPVIYGYVSGYANSSSARHRDLQQYLSPNAEKAAKNGLNGDYELAGSPENAINYTTYGSINNPNELKVQVQVSWLDKISIVGSTEESGSARYSSNYIATLVKSADGGWLVQNFDSMKFVPDES